MVRASYDNAQLGFLHSSRVTMIIFPISAVLQFGQHPSQLLQQELPMRVCLRLFLSKLGSLAFHLPTVMNNPFPFGSCHGCTDSQG